MNRATLFSLLVLAGFSQAQEPRPLKYATDVEGGAPYIYLDKNQKPIGFEVDIVAALEKELGRKIEYKQYEFDSLIPGLQKDPAEFDFAMNGFEVTEERSKVVEFTKPYYFFRQQMVARIDETRFRSWAEVKKNPAMIVGTLDGSEAAERLREVVGNSRTRSYRSPPEVYAELSRGAIDAVVMDVPIAIAYADPDPTLKSVGEPFWPSTYAIAFRKDDEGRKLRDQFNEAFKKLIQKGTLQAIYKKWDIWNGDQAELLVTYGLVPREWIPQPPEDADEGESIYAETRQGWSITRYLPMLLEATLVTIQLAFAGFALAVVLGLFVALGRLYGPNWVKALCLVYVEFFRGIPVLLLLFFLYFGLPTLGTAFGMPWLNPYLSLSPFLAATLGLGLNYAAYEAEVYRAGIGAVPSGQWEAAASLGMSSPVAFRRVILPQAMRTILPPMTSDFVSVFKDTSIASMIAVVELNKAYQILAKSSLKFLEIGAIVALIYLILAVPLGYLSRYLEKKWAAENEE